MNITDRKVRPNAPITPTELTARFTEEDFVIVVGALRRLAGKASLFPRNVARRRRAREMLLQLDINS